MAISEAVGFVSKGMDGARGDARLEHKKLVGVSRLAGQARVSKKLSSVHILILT